MKKSLLFLWVACLILMAVSEAGAGDREDLTKLYKGSSRSLKELKVADPWAMASWSAGDGGGMDLYQKIDGKWQYMIGGGGAIGASELNKYGVPQGLWKKLLSYTPSQEAIDEALKNTGPYWKEETSKKKLVENDLLDKGDWELTLMRNEIYARYGRKFADPYLASYFKSRSWYRVNPSFSETMLTATEKYNAELILKYQNRKKKN